MVRGGEADTAVEAGAVADLAGEAVVLADLVAVQPAVGAPAEAGEVHLRDRTQGAIDDVLQQA